MNALTMAEAFYLSILQGQVKSRLLQKAFLDILGGNSPPSCLYVCAVCNSATVIDCLLPGVTVLAAVVPYGLDVSGDLGPNLLIFASLTWHGALDMREAQ